MSLIVGQIIAYLKIGVVAFVIMAGVWLWVRIVEKRARDKARSENKTRPD